MKRKLAAPLTFLLLVLAVLLGGCASLNPWSRDTQPGLPPASNTATPVRDVTISTDYQDQGIRVEYTLTGEIKRIVITGQADAWKGNVDVNAEMDAMDKMVKYVYGRDVSSERKITIYAKTLEDSRDNTLNRFKNVDGTVSFQARDVEAAVAKEGAARDPTVSENERNNTSRRVAERMERQITETMTSITSRGRLVGIRKTGDRVVQNGRVYVATYEWSMQDQNTVNRLRQLMGQ
jgi:hypothetical protein